MNRTVPVAAIVSSRRTLGRGGEIVCPILGTIAIDRCRQRQQDTFADVGQSCVCATYRDYEATARLPARHRELPPERVAHAKISQNCRVCGKPSPEGSHIYAGRCKPCREQQRSQRAAALSSLTSEPPAPSDAPKPRRQALLPLLADDEIRRLQVELARREREIKRLRYLLDGVVHRTILVSQLQKLLDLPPGAIEDEAEAEE